MNFEAGASLDSFLNPCGPHGLRLHYLANYSPVQNVTALLTSVPTTFPLLALRDKPAQQRATDAAISVEFSSAARTRAGSMSDAVLSTDCPLRGVHLASRPIYEIAQFNERLFT